MGLFTQVFHVRLNQHLFQLHEVAMGFVFHLDDTPWILTSSNGLVANLDELVASHDGEWKERIHRGICLGAGFVIRGKLIDANSVGFQLGHDAEFELGELALRYVVGFRDDRDDVDLGF